LNRYLLPSFFIALFLHFSLAFTDPGIFKVRPAIPKKRSRNVIAIDLIKSDKPNKAAQNKEIVVKEENTIVAKEPEKKSIKKLEEGPKLEKTPDKPKKKKKIEKPVQENVIKKASPPRLEKKPVQKMEPDPLPPEKNEISEKKDISLPKEISSMPKSIPSAPGKTDKISQPEDSLPHTPAPTITMAVPRYKKNRPPAYPRLARRRGYQGRVVLEVLVREDGSAGAVRLEKSSGHTLLDEAAIEAVKKWLFSPGRERDEVVEMWVKIPVRFRLK